MRRLRLRELGPLFSSDLEKKQLMTEEFAKVGDLQLCYETIGQSGNPAVLLMTGLGGQLIHWPTAFCHALAERGFYVIRYDHRDAGRSTVLHHLPVPPRFRLLRKDGLGAPYLLSDLANDAAGLLDVLDIGSAHVVGMSLGGIVGQTLAVRHPNRVRSLVSIAANTGAAKDHPKLPVLLAMVRRPPQDRRRFVRQAVIASKIFGSDLTSDEARRFAEAQFDRGVHPEGILRQLGAIFAAGDRTRQVANIAAPTVVIHGTNDRILPASGGQATAAAIPDAELHMVPGMGHALLRQHWDQFITWIVANAQRVQAR
jgi:pimeloyl-ACP methyl ester carboxylesterase